MKSLLSAESLTRSQLARRVCEQLNWVNRAGRLKEMSCRVALLRMEWVVNNSRFLLLPWVQCHNLGSWVLGRVGRQLPQDWQNRYGYEPVLLESFVETQRFAGTCYRAANWLCLGQTLGRGKLEKSHASVLPIKDLFVRPLRSDFRDLLCR